VAGPACGESLPHFQQISKVWNPIIPSRSVEVAAFDEALVCRCAEHPSVLDSLRLRGLDTPELPLANAYVTMLVDRSSLPDLQLLLEIKVAPPKQQKTSQSFGARQLSS